MGCETLCSSSFRQVKHLARRFPSLIFYCLILILLLNPGKSESASVQSAAATFRRSLFPNLPIRCPPQCTCDTLMGSKKRVSCLGGGLKSIPTSLMDKETQVIVFSGTAEHPHEAAIGRIFMDLPNLEEVRITYSSLPMIGESTFWPGKELTLLDLSNNRIDRIKDSDFNPLFNLKVLNLSDNNLHDIPSACFRFLTNLTKLDLARNRITKLVPRMFYKLERLEFLDLSENPMMETEITGVIFQDIKSLKILKLEKSGIKSISHLTYQELPGLRELHLSENNLSFLGSYEFTSLSSLKSLYLDGNRLNIIRDNAFFGLRLTHLGLSRNVLTSLPTCAFCNLQVESLDLSSNRFTIFQPGLLRPLSMSLIALNAGSNALLHQPSQSISELLRPLRKVQIVKISWNHLNDSLPDDTFNQLSSLQSLDMSQNQLSNISAKWFTSLSRLESLDLSYNLIHAVDREVLMSFESIHTLKSIHLENNPWICKRCTILPLMDWISMKSPAAYFNVCHKESSAAHSQSSPSSSSSSSPSPNSLSPLHYASHSTTTSSSVQSNGGVTPSVKSFNNLNGCVICTQPEELAGRPIHLMTEHELEYCTPDPRINLRLISNQPKLGLIFSVIILAIASLIVVIVAIVYKFKQAAVYYTHEEDRFTNSSDFSRPKVSPNHLGNNSLRHPDRHRRLSIPSPMIPPPHHHHHHLPVFIGKSVCGLGTYGQRVRRSFMSLRGSASSSSSTSSPSSCNPFPSCSPFNRHSTSFTRKFTNKSNYKSPFKSPFKQRSRKSISSNHSTSPLSQSSSSSSNGSPTGVENRTQRVRF